MLFKLKFIYKHMSNLRLVLITATIVLAIVQIFVIKRKNVVEKFLFKCATNKFENFIENKKKILKNKLGEYLKTSEISPVKQEYESYQSVCDQLKKWSLEIPEITEMVTYGKTVNGTDCNYLRIGTKDKPKVLVQSGLYGDEEYAILSTMNLIERMLSDYGKDEDINWIIENRDIYFIPVLSPDTFLKSEKIEGYNPHISFPYPKRPNNASPSPIKLVMGLMNQLKFKAVLCNHTFGENIYPPEICNKQDGDKICMLIDKMIGLNGYNTERIENANGSGTDVDWFYSAGSCSIKMMWGKKSRQYIDYGEISPSLERNFKSILLFMKEATEIELHPMPLRTIYYYEAD